MFILILFVINSKFRLMCPPAFIKIPLEWETRFDNSPRPDEVRRVYQQKRWLKSKRDKDRYPSHINHVNIISHLLNIEVRFCTVSSLHKIIQRLLSLVIY